MYDEDGMAYVYMNGQWTPMVSPLDLLGVSDLRSLYIGFRSVVKGIIGMNPSSAISNFAKAKNIYSGQKSLKDAETVEKYFMQMKNGSFDVSNGAGGFMHDGKIILTDGNHRMNAAIKYAIETGNDVFVNGLIKNGNFRYADPLKYGYNIYNLPIK